MNNHFISWQEWEKHVLDFFQFVLLKLREEPTLPHLEADKAKDNLNRRLSILCRKNIFAWRKANRKSPFFSINFNGRNQARQEDLKPHPSENKEPDLQVVVYSDPVRQIDYFYSVECKRLYSPPHGNCQYYVNDGVLRFVKRDFSYGIDVSSGLMIGYVQALELSDFLRHINNYCNKASIANLNLIDDWNPKGVSRLSHSLIRSEMRPSDFLLNHLWVDIRDIKVVK